MHDGISFERRGIPAASIITSEFIITGRAMAEAAGAPKFPFLVVQHPLSNLTPDQIRQRAEAIAPEVVKVLLGKGT